MLSKNFILSNIFITLIFLFTACLSIKPSGGKYNPSDYESFFLGEGRTQYFIQPITFKGSSSNLEIDFTFRDGNLRDSTVVSNFTVTSENTISKIDSLIFRTPDSKIKASNIEKIYHQKDGKKQKIRSTSNINGLQLGQIFESDNLKISIYGNNTELNFETSKKISKKRIRIYSNLIQDLLIPAK